MPGVQTITPKFGRHKVTKDAAAAFRKNNGAAARAANAIKPDAQPEYLSNTDVVPGMPVRIEAAPQQKEKLKVAYAH